MFKYFVVYTLLDPKNKTFMGSGDFCFSADNPISNYSDIELVKQGIAARALETDGIRASIHITFIARMPI